MAKRPDNHITGDYAIRKISAALIPEEWTISTPEADYGLDMLIEVVIDNTTTGKFFFIQSKGTLDSSRNGIITYSMDVERIKDYQKIELPVLFVYYSKPENKFWGRWMNYLYMSLTPQQREQQTVTLTFSSRNSIDVDYLRSIGAFLDSSITRRLSLLGDKISDEFIRFHHKLLSLSQQFLGSIITDDSHLTCETISLSYEGTPQKGVVMLSSSGETINIPTDLISCEFLYLPLVKQEDCPDCVLDAIYLIAFFCSKYSSICVEYILTNPREKALDYISLDKWQKYLSLLPLESLNRVNGLFEIAVQDHHKDIAQSILIVVFSASIDHPGLQSLYRELLSYYLNNEQKDENKGNICYSLANSMRSANLYESLSLYMRAVRFEPLYRELYYWWQEIGGVLYLTGHYYFAEHFYKKARKISKKECREDIGILISDCLICQGKIKNAIKEEQDYINNSEGSISSRVLLKSIITESMDDQEIKDFAPIFWFNQGIAASKEGNHSEALNCFLYAWRLDDGDIESLVNAFFEAYNNHDTVKTAYILNTIREQSPNEGYRMIVSAILSNKIPLNIADGVLDGLKRLLYPND